MNQAVKQQMRDWAQQANHFFCANEWHKPSSEREFSLRNPADGTEVTRFNFCSPADVDRCVEQARLAYQTQVFRKLPMRQRAKILRDLGQVIRDHSAELAALESLCNGKLYQSESLLDDMPDSADVFDYYAGWIDKSYAEVVPTNPGTFNYTLNEPYGVCALIIPWNFPLLLACWKLACALATGNTVVIKPSEYTPLSLMYFLDKAVAKQILPQGIIQMILGDASIGDYLVHHPEVDKVSFTGSTATGRKIVRASADSNLKGVSLELGGKSPNIIFADCKQLDTAIDHAFSAMFSHKGEKCTGPSRLLVEDKIYERVLERMQVLSDNHLCGDPFNDRSQQGPQCYQDHFDRVMSYIQDGVAAGAKVIAGGVRDTQGENEKGLFIRPTIFADVRADMAIVREEIFGPVLTVQSFSSEEEAIQLANDSSYGLAAGFYTADMNRAHRLASALEAGMIFINRYGMYEFSSPFGGFKQSGWGYEMGSHSLKEFTRCKSVWYNFN
ncbi:MAG: aldehyde dehydrogenase family protein [Legionella sp.]|nr:MAG: aldehyde dehydrogenase family protein [Legionella sp.]